MMKRQFLKKIKPFLVALCVFDLLRSVYFFIARAINRLRNLINKRTRKTVPVLLYHRVDNVVNDPVMLTVSPDTFEEHIKYINIHYKPVSLSLLVDRIKNANLVGNEICVTFDDGYKDNLTKALPILEKYNTPASIFVTTLNLGNQASFDWDMKYQEKDRAFFLSKEEIKTLAAHPLIEIGAHTQHHLRLSDLSRDQQFTEIKTSKNILEDIIGKKIVHFAYPFGGKQDFNFDSKKIVQELGFLSAYENTGLLGTVSSDIYAFPRINIRDCSVKSLSGQLFE